MSLFAAFGAVSPSVSTNTAFSNQPLGSSPQQQQNNPWGDSGDAQQLVMLAGPGTRGGTGRATGIVNPTQ